MAIRQNGMPLRNVRDQKGLFSPERLNSIKQKHNPDGDLKLFTTQLRCGHKLRGQNKVNCLLSVVKMYEVPLIKKSAQAALCW